MDSPALAARNAQKGTERTNSVAKVKRISELTKRLAEKLKKLT